MVHRIFETRPNAHILSYDLLTYAGNLANLNAFKDHKHHTFIKADIGDVGALKSALEHFKPNFIIHLAAETHVDRSIKDGHAFINTNVTAHAKFLEELRIYYQNLSQNEQSEFKFIHISTDEVFGELSSSCPSFTEQTPYSPRSPYAASKASGDHLTRAWHHTYDLPSIILNCSNNYGPYQYPEKLIPLMILNALAEKPLPVYGRGEQIRDWLNVNDHCDAILYALKNGKSGETYCIGGNNEKPNIDIVRSICTLLDHYEPRENGESYSKLITYVEDRPGHDFRYAIDSTKAKNELGWKAGIDFAKGLEETVLWYLNNQDWCIKVQNTEYRNWLELNYADRAK